MPSDSRAAGLPADITAILTEVAGIAATPGRLAERAEALLAQLQRMIPSDAGVITLLAADRDTPVALARTGYDEQACRFLDSASFLADAELIGLHRARRPTRFRDLPVPPSALAGWPYMEAAGLRDGIGVGLFTPEGRYVGLLNLNTHAADRITEADRELLGLLATPIASAVDPLRPLSTIAGLVHEAMAGVVLAPSGATLPLPGLPVHQLFASGSGVLAAATAHLAEGGPYVSFHAPLPVAEGAQSHIRITALAGPPDLRFFAAAVVLASPAGDLHGLSPRELEVLGLLVTGASNQRIAAALGITARTVEQHVDHLRAKLGAPSRTTAAVRALSSGLFVPPL